MNLKPKDILKLIREHQIEVQDVKRYRDAINNKYNIRYKEAKDNRANNKVPINFAKKIKNNVHGYMYGEPFTVTHKDNELLQEFMSELFAYNHKDKLLSDLGEDIIDVGKAYWILYIDKNKYLKILQIPIEEMIFIRNGKDKDIVDMAIRYYYRDGVDVKRQELVVEVYTDEAVYYYVEDTKGGLVPDYGEGEPVKYHIFGHVPVLEFLNNDGQSEYKDVLDLIELYIELLNAGVDEVEETKNAYLAILGAFLDDETIDKALKSRVFMVESDTDTPIDIKFINRNLNTESFESFLDRIRRLIYEVAGIPDMQSLENKTQDLSGRAMKQLLREMENRCRIKENNMRYTLTRFLRVIRRYVKIKAGLDYNLSDFEITFKRNTIEDATTVGTMDDFVKLKDTGLLDTETLLSLLTFIDDPQNIIEKKKKEDDELYGINYVFGEGHGND